MGAVSGELIFCLNGRTLASDIARDSLQDAMFSDPVSTDFMYGLLTKAMAFLAGYGIYVSVATDKLVGRMLDNFASRHSVRGHPLLGPFNSHAFSRAQKYCRVGVLANTIRLVIKELRTRDIRPVQWNFARTWKRALPENKVRLTLLVCVALLFRCL